MSKYLTQLLAKPEEEVTRFISKMESLSGYPSEDIRLSTEIKTKTSRQLLSLGFDPDDTTSRELLAALRIKFQSNALSFSKTLGFNDSHSSDSLHQAMIKIISAISGNTWAIKKHILKELLTSSPPKKVMKIMGYRSVQSMLKREGITEIYTAAAAIESARWKQIFWKKHTLLHPSDFEIRPIEFSLMNSERWNFFNARAGVVTCALPLGAASVWPTKNHGLSTTASLAVHLLEAVEHIKVYSCALKLEQMSGLFGHKILGFMSSELLAPVSIEGLAIKWDALHRHYGRYDSNMLPGCFDPHLVASDLHSKTVSEHMANLHPTFSWWTNNDFAAHLTGSSLTSLNLSDVVASSLGNVGTGMGLTKSLWSELINRYMGHSGVEKFIRAQLDNDGSQKETISTRVSNITKSPHSVILAEFA